MFGCNALDDLILVSSQHTKSQPPSKPGSGLKVPGGGGGGIESKFIVQFRPKLNNFLDPSPRIM